MSDTTTEGVPEAAVLSAVSLIQHAAGHGRVPPEARALLLELFGHAGCVSGEDFQRANDAVLDARWRAYDEQAHCNDERRARRQAEAERDEERARVRALEDFARQVKAEADDQRERIESGRAGPTAEVRVYRLGRVADRLLGDGDGTEGTDG